MAEARTFVVARPLTVLERERIQTDIDEASGVWNVFVAGLRGVYDALLSDVGETWQDYGPQRQLVCTDFGIARDDWSWALGAIQEAVKRVPGDSGDREIAVMMEWLNLAPSVLPEMEG